MSVIEEASNYTRRMKLKEPRSPHHTWFGAPKRVYHSEEHAVEAARHMERITSHIFEAYKCPESENGSAHWHCGHAQQKMRDLSVSRQDALYLELGERVLSHMKAENRPSKSDAFKFLRRRMRSVYRLAMLNYVPPARKLP